MNGLMGSFPPRDGEQVTLANWRTGPFTHWAFHHVREIVPTAEIANSPHNVWEFDDAFGDFSDLSIESGTDGPITLDTFLSRTDTDGFVVLHKGRCVFETYSNGMGRHDPHIVFSVSKSMLGLLAGILVEKQIVDVEAPVTKYVPEMSATAYNGASVRDLLDMRAGVLFDEDYLATSGPIVDYRKATNWNPLEPGDKQDDLRGFYAQLTERDGQPGGAFHYTSPNTDLLGWVFERASGVRFSDLMSRHLWQPMGAERSASITVDRLGAPRTAGGISMIARDLARVGQLILQGGRRDGVSIIAESWIDDLYENGDPDAWNAGDFAKDFPGLDMHYRSKWYVLRGDAPILFGLGIHGQNLFIDRKNQVVIAKVASRPAPLDTELELLGLKAVRALGDHLAG